MKTMLEEARPGGKCQWTRPRGRTALSGTSGAAIEHLDVADHVTRRIVVVGADQAAAVKTTLEWHNVVPQGTEHHPVQRRYGLFLQQ
ncbi:MAG TPA: hypothetical protein VI056_07195 [Candidatus Limnocylindria bacterium]